MLTNEKQFSIIVLIIIYLLMENPNIKDACYQILLKRSDDTQI